MDLKNELKEVGADYQLLTSKKLFFVIFLRQGFFGLEKTTFVAILATFVVFGLKPPTAPANPNTWISKMLWEKLEPTTNF